METINIHILHCGWVLTSPYLPFDTGNAGMLKLTNGVPCGDTILRIVESVNPTQLRASLDCCRGHIIESLCGHH